MTRLEFQPKLVKFAANIIDFHSQISLRMLSEFKRIIKFS